MEIHMYTTRLFMASKGKNQILENIVNLLEDPKYRRFCQVKGDIGVWIVSQKHFSKLPTGVRIIDGHEPFSSVNLRPIVGVMKDGTEKEILPCHLDLVGVKARNEVTFICEVKTTVNNGRIFKANGYCMDFMKKAKELGIPTYLAVVRLSRDIDKNIMVESCAEQQEGTA